ncbi:MAG: hypothetical protein J0L62_13715 [Bacteroidetes bacterium]|nr:hypothetical protein [Bacteroidota bacterium]
MLFATFFSCSTNVLTNEKGSSFNTFISKFKPLDLPLKIDLDDKTLLKNSQIIDPNSTDTLFIKPNGNFVAYGYLKDTKDFFSLIYVVIGDGPYFRIANFDKEFNQIADTSILNSEGCVPGTLCLVCNTTIQINENKTIRTLDSMNYLNCDSTGNSSGSILSKSQLEQIISIDKKGHFKITSKNSF